MYNADGEEQTVEEELLGALLDANEALIGALRMYDDVMRVVEERVAVEISKREVKIDRRVSIINSLLVYMESPILNHTHSLFFTSHSISLRTSELTRI